MLLVLYSFLLTVMPCILASPWRSLNPQGTSSNTSCSRRSKSSGNGTKSDVVARAWYPGWHATATTTSNRSFPPNQISWSKYNSVSYAFAVTTPDSSVSLASADEQLLPQFVELAHENNVEASLSIGGWTGSQYFSTGVATATNRTALVQSVLSLVSQYNLDGIDFDWEYPNAQGIGCNTKSPNDSANFLLFLQQLRSEPAGQNLTLSASVGIKPFMGSDGTPMTEVSDFAKVLNFIEIMAYDIWGSWTSSGVGPNAPLDDSCASIKEGSAVSAVAAWTQANFTANQIVLGVASYGHSFHVDSSAAITSSGDLAAYPPFVASLQPAGDAWDSPAGVDQCGNPTPIGGIFNFWGLVSGGFLNGNGTAASGIDYRYDNCSQTPYVYNSTTQVMVSYDDATSFAAKGDYIKSAGLKGFSMWDAAGDYQNILLNSIGSALGIE